MGINANTRKLFENVRMRAHIIYDLSKKYLKSAIYNSLNIFDFSLSLLIILVCIYIYAYTNIHTRYLLHNSQKKDENHNLDFFLQNR